MPCSNKKARLLLKQNKAKIYCYNVRDIEGNYITKEGKSYKQVPYNLAKRISHNNNWQFIPSLHLI